LHPFHAAAARESPAALPPSDDRADIAQAQRDIDDITSEEALAPSKMQTDWEHIASEALLHRHLSFMPEIQRSFSQLRTQRADALAQALATNFE